MKTISAITLATALVIGGAAFAQTNNATSDNRADGAANTAVQAKPGSNTGINANGDLNKDGVKVDAKASHKSSTTGSAVKGDASTQGTANVLHPEKNNEKSLIEQKK